MAGHEGAVGEHAAIADDAIVRHVAVRHEEIAAADHRLHGMSGAAMDGHVFAEDVVVADFERGRFVVVFEMLRPFAEDGAGEYLIVLAHGHWAEEIGAGPNQAVIAYGDVAFNESKWANFDIFAEPGLWRNDG